MNSIENIYNNFRINYQDKPNFTLDFYNTNAVLLNNVKTFTDSEQLRLYIELLCHYLSAKYQKCHYNDILQIVDEKKPIIDKEISRLDSSKLKDNWYYGLIFYKGMASYNLKDYKTATPIFKELVNFDSKNDRYKNWLRYSQYGQRIWISQIINIACCAIFVLSFFAGEQILSPLANLWMVGSAFVGLTLATGYDYYIKYNSPQDKKE